MIHLIPHESKPLAPKQENLDYIMDLFNSHKTGIFSRGEIIKGSRLTKTQTLRALEILIEQGLIAKDGVKNVFYLL